jgi:riboflavin biosynthesis pyrimidine reductase
LDGATPIAWRRIFSALYSQGVTSVLVEGGSRTLGGVLAEGYGDRIHAFVAPGILGAGLPAFSMTTPGRLEDRIRVAVDEVEVLDRDVLISGRITR